MKKITATLIAGLFATAAFAQTTTTAPAPTKAEVKADAKEAKAEVKADAKDAKATLKADTKEAKAAVKADTKEAKPMGKSSIHPPAEPSTTGHTGHTGTHGADVSATAKTK
jgi:hypothetical protein